MSRKIISLLLTAMLILLFIFSTSAQLADTPCLMFHHDFNHKAWADTTQQETVGASLTIYVPDNYTTIQAAVNNATAGDTIIVRDGTYSENVDANENGTAVKTWTWSIWMLGDLNHNNRLDTGDATLVLRMIVGLTPVDYLGDMNGNGRIDTGDATIILRIIVGLPV